VRENTIINIFLKKLYLPYIIKK